MILENNKLRIICFEDHGGKLSSIYDKEKNIEFLFQNPKLNYKKANLYSDFSDFEACGFDDTFPSIDEGIFKINDKEIRYPDHGEIWSANMDCVSDNNTIKLNYISKILPYTFQKKITLEKSGLRVDYSIKNIGDYKFPCFYTFHCLIDSKEKIELITPQELNEVKIVHGSNRLNTNSIESYPITNNNINLQIPKLLDKGQCEKFYFTQKVENGLLGYNYKRERVKLLISYDNKKLPYLGFWNTQGGFRDDYNFALEMSNGYYDSIETASKNNACPYLDIGEEFTFSIHFEIKNY